MNTHCQIPDRSAPLTEAQEGLWYAPDRDRDCPGWNAGLYLELLGPLDMQAMTRALWLTITDTPALSLRFVDPGDGPRQKAGPALMPGFADLSMQPESEAQALAMMHSDNQRPLELSSEPAAALTLFVIDPNRHFIYLRIHHLAIDSYGMVLVLNRIAAHYTALIEGAPKPLPFGPLSLANEEDAAYRNSSQRLMDRKWWHNQLAGLPPVPATVGKTARYLRDRRQLPVQLIGMLTDFAHRNALEWQDVLRALTGAYLARQIGGATTIGLLYPARKGRSIELLPCTATNVLPYHLQPDEQSPLSEWLATETARMAQSRDHGLYRSELLEQELGLPATARLYGPVVRVHTFEKPPEFTGLECHLHALNTGAVDDMALTFRGDPPSGIVFDLDGNPALYSHAELQSHGDRLEAFLIAALQADRLAAVQMHAKG